jgi:hypothetical protein
MLPSSLLEVMLGFLVYVLQLQDHLPSLLGQYIFFHHQSMKLTINSAVLEVYN